jgi:hypothetical protein
VVKIKNKDVRHLARRFEEAGCQLTYTGKGHVRVSYEGKTIAVLPATPSDRRSLINCEKDARKSGLFL